MKILVAPDKFKECLTAAEAAGKLADAATRVFSEATVTGLPLADGGDGFAETLRLATGGNREEIVVTGPSGAPVTGAIVWIEAAKIPPAALALLDLRAYGKIAVIDAASVAGLALVPVESRDPFHATSRGVGELIVRAAERGATAIILGLGGVATNDLGLGALEAAGLELSAPGAGI